MATIKDLEVELKATQDTLNNLIATVNKLATSITNFNNTGNRKLDAALKVGEVNFDIELAIKQKLLEAVKESITSVLNCNRREGLEPIILAAFDANKTTIKNCINTAIQEEFNEINLVPFIKEQFKAKIAKSLLSGLDSLIDSSLVELKKDVKFKAQLVMAIDGLIKEYSKQ